MQKNMSRITHYALRYPYREWAILAGFSILTGVMLYPLSIHLAGMVPEPTDPLLNAWRMQWNGRAFLSGPAAIAHIFDTNIFYPFPLTLAYSEHFLLIAAQALPFLVVADSHLVGMNLSVLATFVLSGYGMYLLVTVWTGHRWAGLAAGVLLAYAPHRFGQINHLELLVTQWMPLTLLALHWTLTRPGVRYPLLFGLFFNLQMLSGFHYGLNLTIACGLLAIIYTLFGRVRWRWGLWGAAAASVLLTLLLNWPIWRMYLRFSDVMGAVRTPGEVRIYSAALTDYLTTLPHNLFYGWTFRRWQPENHQIQPLMPAGVIGFLLAIIGLFPLFRKQRAPFSISNPKSHNPHPTSHISYPTSHISRPAITFLLLLTLTSLILSFGLNENALGPGLAPLLKYSPYHWLYKNIPIFQGIRVPGRFGILAVFGLSGLAGFGVAQLSSIKYQVTIRNYQLPITNYLFPLLIMLILMESWSAPLNPIGPKLPVGEEVASIYHWLRQETNPEDVVLELPYGEASEFWYEYNSSYHWRPLANGGTGFTPPIYKDMRRWFSTFPDARSVDVIQQLGIDLVILHPGFYSPEAWQQVMAELPLYLPAIEQIYQIDEAVVLRIAEPVCNPNADAVHVALAPAQLDGLPNAVAVNYKNSGHAAFVADVRQVSQLTFAPAGDKNFTEPLVTPAGETQSVIVPLQHELQKNSLTGAWLATLNRTISVEEEKTRTLPALDENLPWQPLGLNYADGPQLAAYYLMPQAPTACGALTVALNWEGGQPGDTALVQWLDPFGRIVAEDEAQPWAGGQGGLDVRTLPLTGSLPAGRYGFRVFVKAPDGAERLPITDDGVTIPTNQIPPLPVDIHPGPYPVTADAVNARFGDTINLRGGTIPRKQVQAGDWLRFWLVWQVTQPLDTELTVFTQLIGPDGQVWGQRDNRPGGGWYGVPLWLPNQPVIDHYAFQIQPDAPPGAYRLIAGLYHSNTQERLRLEDGADFVEIGTVEISNEQ